MSKDAGALSSFFRGTRVRRAGFRFDALEEVSSGAGNDGRQQGEQPFDARASDSAGGVAVYRNAAGGGQRAGLAVARGTGTSTVRPGGGPTKRGSGNGH